MSRLPGFTRKAFTKTFFIFVVLKIVMSEPDVFPCDSQLFCHGKLLDVIQKSEIFGESKEFVDMKVKNQVLIIKIVCKMRFVRNTSNFPNFRIHSWISA